MRSKSRFTVDAMKSTYMELESLQAEMAVTRKSRLTIYACLCIRMYVHVCSCMIDLIKIFTFSSCFRMQCRPDAQKDILRLCAACTKSDVALNNLVLRARYFGSIIPLFQMRGRYPATSHLLFTHYICHLIIRHCPGSSRHLQRLSLASPPRPQRRRTPDPDQSLQEWRSQRWDLQLGRQRKPSR